MCNKQFKTTKDIKINYEDHEFQCISVDNEAFYSDHVANKKHHVLTTAEYRQVFDFALPHEFKFYNCSIHTDDSKGSNEANIIELYDKDK